MSDDPDLNEAFNDFIRECRQREQTMHKANQLWTKTAFKNVPPLYAQDDKGDEAIAYVKFFCPLNGWRWYITEYDPATGEAFGLVQGYEVELGYIPVQEINPGDWEGDDLQSQNNHWRERGFRMPPIERDLHFTPTTLGHVRESIRTGHPA